jgi:AraC-like DNA-binding protein
MAEHGYRRADQFARDFKRHFGVSPKRARALADEGREQ